MSLSNHGAGFGWLSWTGDQGEPTLAHSLTPPGDSETYVNPNDPSDHTLSVGDWVRGRPGVSNAKAIRAALDALKGREIIVPVWDAASGQGSNLQYRLAGFARVQLTGYRLPGQNRISAIYLGMAVCGGTGPAPVMHPEQSRRTIRYTYDKLYRLTGVGYSTGQSFAYAHDRVSNRVAMTETMPLSGTLVAAYTYDAANRLTRLAFSDGRVYTYTWSPRGQMLAEWTQGYPVRAFAYDTAGRMVEARVLTLTTHFAYTSASLSAGNGLGARVAVSVDGHGTTSYTLDYAADNRILAEQTITGTTLYLYGRDCLGELRDAEWMYYLHDGAGYVRQGVDEQGQVVSAWAYDPTGTVLEGPQGPVSHLVCGGVYDWSTGLLYKGGGYFDPTLGIWLALTPLVVIQAWQGRKRRRGFPWYAVLLLIVCVGGSLAACAPSMPPPPPCPSKPSFTSLRAEFLHTPRTRVVPVDPPEPGMELPAKALKLSNSWQNNEGVQFIGVVSAPQCVAEGDLFMIQNIAEKRTRRRLDGSWEGRGDGVTWMLDRQIPYDPDFMVHISAPADRVVYDTNYDAPSTPLVGDPKARDLVEVRVDDQFKMYMVWQPSNEANYYPVGTVSWYWRATAIRILQPDGQPRPEDEWIVTNDSSFADLGVATEEYPLTSPNVVDLNWIPIAHP